MLKVDDLLPHVAYKKEKKNMKPYAKINKEMETKKKQMIEDEGRGVQKEEAAPRMRTRGRRVQEGGAIKAGGGQGRGGRENPAL